MRLVTFTEYSNLELAAMDWVIPEMIPKPGNIVLLGAPKAGKSLFTFQMCLAIAQGKPWHGMKVNQHTVLYLQMDTPVSVWKHMIDKVVASGEDLSGPLWIPHPEDFPKPYNITDATFREALKKVIKKLNPDVVVLDVLREMHNMDENDSQQMKTFSDYLETIFHGRTLIQIHHTRKLPDNYKGQNPGNASRGSSYLTGKSDAFWLLHNDKMYVTPRFRETFTMEFSRIEASGFFNLENGFACLPHRQDPQLLPAAPKVPKAQQTLEYLKGLVTRSPDLTKSQVYDLYESDLIKQGISRPTFFRKLAGWFPVFDEVVEVPHESVHELVEPITPMPEPHETTAIHPQPAVSHTSVEPGTIAPGP